MYPGPYVHAKCRDASSNSTQIGLFMWNIITLIKLNFERNEHAVFHNSTFSPTQLRKSIMYMHVNYAVSSQTSVFITHHKENKSGFISMYIYGSPISLVETQKDNHFSHTVDHHYIYIVYPHWDHFCDGNLYFDFSYFKINLCCPSFFVFSLVRINFL